MKTQNTLQEHNNKALYFVVILSILLIASVSYIFASKFNYSFSAASGGGSFDQKFTDYVEANSSYEKTFYYSDFKPSNQVTPNDYIAQASITDQKALQMFSLDYKNHSFTIKSNAPLPSGLYSVPVRISTILFQNGSNIQEAYSKNILIRSGAPSVSAPSGSTQASKLVVTQVQDINGIKSFPFPANNNSVNVPTDKFLTLKFTLEGSYGGVKAVSDKRPSAPATSSSCIYRINTKIADCSATVYLEKNVLQNITLTILPPANTSFNPISTNILVKNTATK